MNTALLESSIVPATATQHHLQELREQGFTIMEGAMSPDQLTRARAAIDRLNNAPGAAPESARLRIHVNLTNRDEVFRELVQHRGLLDVIEPILGEDCILSGVNHHTVYPGTKAGMIHRDRMIWGPSLFWMDQPVGINVGWAFDDFTLENGATLIQPGSHLDPHITGDPQTPVIVPAGSFFLFDDRTFHRSGENCSSAPRRSAFVFYIRSWLKPQTDHKRSTSSEIITSASPTLLRLLGFQRQSPIEYNDSRSVIVPATGATWFYNEVKG
jgi:fumagillin biosynthesis dioxygenase